MADGSRLAGPIPTRGASKDWVAIASVPGASVPTDRDLLHINLTFMETLQWPESR